VKSLQWGALALATSFLCACGGGGGDTPPSAPPSVSAEGAYAGTMTGSANNSFQLVVLEDGSYWGLYGILSGSTLYLTGFLQGTSSVSGNQLTSTDLKDFGVTPPAGGTINATVTPSSSSISGTAAFSNGSVTFSGNPPAAGTYVYSSTPSLSTLAGSWSMSALGSGASVSVTAQANGSFTAVSSGCTVTGTMSPRPSGKNVFNVSLTSGPSPCAAPGTTMTGIALSYPANGQTRLIVAATNAARTQGLAVIGQR
jgi:hypothetical protein